MTDNQIIEGLAKRLYFTQDNVTDDFESVWACANQRLWRGQATAALAFLKANGWGPRDEVLEEAAKILNDKAQEWNKIRDPGMANQARSYAAAIRALKIVPR